MTNYLNNMIISIILLTILLGVSIYINYSLLKRNEELEETYNTLADEYEAIYEKIIRFEEIVNNTNQKLKEIDYRGSFESDDEVGFFFKELKTLQEDLNKFLK